MNHARGQAGRASAKRGGPVRRAAGRRGKMGPAQRAASARAANARSYLSSPRLRTRAVSAIGLPQRHQPSPLAGFPASATCRATCRAIVEGSCAARPRESQLRTRVADGRPSRRRSRTASPPSPRPTTSPRPTRSTARAARPPRRKPHLAALEHCACARSARPRQALLARRRGPARSAPGTPAGSSVGPCPVSLSASDTSRDTSTPNPSVAMGAPRSARPRLEQPNAWQQARCPGPPGGSRRSNTWHASQHERVLR